MLFVFSECFIVIFPLNMFDQAVVAETERKTREL